MDAGLRMLYDPDTETVRVRFADDLRDSIAVPMEDLTILLSASLDSVLGLDIQDLPTFVRRYVADQLIPVGARGVQLFEAAKPHLDALMLLLTRNLGPIAKDRVALWDEIVQKVIKEQKLAQDRTP